MRILLILFSIQIISACTSNQYLEKVERPEMSLHKESVYVTNPEIGKQFDILKNSKIYNLSNDENSTLKLTILPRERIYMCGNSLIASVILLGLIPVSLPDTYFFQYEIENEGATQKYSHVIPVYSRISVWEWLFKPFSKAEDELVIKGLSQSKREINN